ncbi:NADH-dependent dehydrogenase [Jannaschia pagri]|uniref:NADH-dependent dehydrogenase n=1 Tax=Jannaschia pagri TaxID=2829797 RepID=A0ABQ4NGF2_9RHOB|nr:MULTISPECIES: Gfo/Idh/MocA family oxidoreductase [unclassified Jannaschia]GIT90391.1 NADH-dependent dehydrogenase [Jannaschia sp. AI_61]GIT93504.1 NADH-dependent dehydrogenase [Jannaschia sp. AI_62]
MTLRVGLLGLGYFAQFHREAWGRIDGATLAATADANPETGATYASLEALLGHGIDLLDIATPPPTHAAAIRAALPHGLRAIICQKPFCTSMEEAQAVTAEAEAAAVPLIVHENFRFQPWFRSMKQALDAGQIGTPLNLTFRLRTGDGQGPEAYLARQPYFQTMPRLLIHETGVHYVDVFRYLLGRPQGVYADLRRLNPAIRGEDAGHVLFDYANGARALFDGNRLLDFDTDTPRRTFGESLLEGTEGTLSLVGTGQVTLRRKGDAGGDVILEGRDWPGFAGDCVHGFQSHVVQAVQGEVAAETSARSYLDVLSLVETVYAASAAGTRLPVLP